jgi:hypothetical protein
MMFASIRRYRLNRGSTDELTRRVDQGFAEEVQNQPGFISYEFIDCGDGETMTMSVFGRAEQAEASRELARHWTEEHLVDLDLTRTAAMHGEVMVSRARDAMLAPAHPSAEAKFASLRRYMLRGGSVTELMHVVDEVFADDVQDLDGFEAYHALDCGHGEILAINLFRDQSSAEESDERALRFVREYLQAFDIERTEIVGGEVVVSRAMADLLEPAHV